MSRTFAIIAVVFLSFLFFGCVAPDVTAGNNTTITNHTSVAEGITIKQSTVGRVGNLSIGVMSVDKDSARLSLWTESDSKTFDLAVGDEVDFGDYTIKNLEVYVNPFPSPMPGSGTGDVTLQVTQRLTITYKELQCGGYYGFQDQKKIGTPDDWVWADAGMSSNWHAPNTAFNPSCYSND